MSQTTICLNTLKKLLHYIPAGIIVINQSQQILLCNHAFRQMWRLPAKYNSTDNLHNIADHMTSLIKEPKIYKQRLLKQLFDSNTYEETMYLHDKRSFSMKSVSFIDDNNGRSRVYFYTNKYNINESNIFSILDNITDAILITSEEEGIVYSNKMYIDLHKITSDTEARRIPTEWITKGLDQIIKPENIKESTLSLLRNAKDEEIEIEFKDGRVFNRKSIAIHDKQHFFRIWIHTELSKKFLGDRDSLTHCLNRTCWDAFIENNILRSEGNKLFCIAVIDINDFKIINDEFGHEAGDKILKRLGELLLELSRDDDMPFRIGGDEFCLVIPTDNDISNNVFNRIESALIASGIDASIGICMTSDEKNILEAFREADEKMLSLKRKAKKKSNLLTSINLITHTRLTKTDEEIAMSADLDIALERGEIHQLYQPIVDVKGRLTSVEVLMRWEKNGKFINPSKFIPLAETNEQIHNLWDWSIENSIKQLSIWKKSGYVTPNIRLNFSSTQVEYSKNSGHSYKDQIMRLCKKYDISSRLLRLELTETTLLKDLIKAKELFEELASIGVRLSIDDYGTGFSSLAMIKVLPVTSIKIDGSFISNLPESESDIAIVTGTIALTQALGIHAVAECVETESQLNCLKKIGCERFQGYYFHKPISSDKLDKLLTKEIY